jgi:hypothetical protein
MIYTFVLGYVGIILETLFEFNKAAIALLMSVAMWTIYGSAATFEGTPMSSVLASLSGHMGEVSEIVYVFSVILLLFLLFSCLCMMTLSLSYPPIAPCLRSLIRHDGV